MYLCMHLFIHSSLHLLIPYPDFFPSPLPFGNHYNSESASFLLCFVTFFHSFYFLEPTIVIHRYAIIFDEILNGIVFLITLSNRPLLTLRNATDFCILILCPETTKFIDKL